MRRPRPYRWALIVLIGGFSVTLNDLAPLLCSPRPVSYVVFPARNASRERNCVKLLLQIRWPHSSAQTEKPDSYYHALRLPLATGTKTRDQDSSRHS
jgi:hypothetical protein